MILKGNEDLRVRRTLDSIKKTFSELICEKDFEDITVKELSDKAFINKKTFYTYYNSLNELLAELQLEISSDYIERIAGLKVPKDMDKLIYEFFMYSVEKGEVYEKITCAGSYEYIRNSMIKKVMNSTMNQPNTEQNEYNFKQGMLRSFIEASGMALYKKWVADGKVVPIKDAIEIGTWFGKRFQSKY